MDVAEPHERRGRRGRAERAAAQKASAARAPQPRLPFSPVAAVSEDQLEAIHQASLTILAEIGMDFLHQEAKAILKEAGADVDEGSDRVCFDKALVESVIGLAPKSFTLHARNAERSVVLGGNAVAFCSVASAPNAADRDGGRRPGSAADFRNLLRLGHSLDAVHLWGGYPVEPADIHPSIRHLDALFDMLTLSDKPIHAYSLGEGRIRDGIEMARIARGIDRAALEREPSLFTIINSSSPLRLDNPMLEGVIQMARANQVVVLTPFTLAGAMAPVTVVGAVAQQNAEALAGLVLAQTVRRGSPFVYGGFTSNVDMKSGAPAFGTPEYVKANFGAGQLARRLGIPWRSSNANASNIADAQAAYESEMSLWGAIMGGCNFLIHGAGWLEGGLTASLEKFILDVEMLQMFAELFQPVAFSEDEMALEDIREVGPGGHFFAAPHTMSRYQSAFYAPLVSDWRNFGQWTEDGSKTATERANLIWKRTLAEFTPPPLDPGRAEALTEFVTRRRAEGGAPPVS